MKKIKRFLVKLLFSKKQREIIQQAVIFSEYTYRRRGKVDEAARVQTVLNEVTPMLGVIKQTFTKEEVDDIVANFAKRQAEIFEDELKRHLKAGADSAIKDLIPVGCVCLKKVEGLENAEEEIEKKEETESTEENKVASTEGSEPEEVDDSKEE